MKTPLASSLWIACAIGLPSVLLAQSATTDSAYHAPYSCADTSLSRWLSADEADDGHKTRARELEEHVLAQTYAPILRFAPSEQYFPTIPYYPAFQPVAGGLAQVVKAPPEPYYLDPTRAFWRERPPDSTWMPYVSAVRHAYNGTINRIAAPYAVKPPIPVVFYRVCDFIAPDIDADGNIRPGNDTLGRASEATRWRDKVAYLWDYLRSDEQAWHRYGMDDKRVGPPTDSLIRHFKQFHVIQYFVYYLQDRGLAGHSEDIEYTFVFVPKSPTGAKAFRVVVGAGHDPPAANNVLALVGPEAGKEWLRHQSVLVELGGHSSAPDVPPFGQFSAGLDVNWHIGDLWGTRDAQATAGLAYSGRYEGAMTYPRDQQDALTLFPSGFATSAGEARQMMADLVRVSPDYLAERAHQASHGARRRSVIVSAERRRLAENVMAAYGQARKMAESQRRTAIATSDSVDKLRHQYGAEMKDSISEAAIGDAKRDDLYRRMIELREITRDRQRQARRGIDSVLTRARCRAVRGSPNPDCPTWLPDQRRRALVETLVGRLEETNRLIPQDVMLEQVLALVPDPDPQPTAMDAIASEIRRVVIERLQPEYSLLPVRYLQAVYRGALKSDPKLMSRYLKLITRMLHPARCDELACGMTTQSEADFNREFDEVVCGRWRSGVPLEGAVAWPNSLACRLQPADTASIRKWRQDTAAVRRWDEDTAAMRLWNQDVYDRPDEGFGKPRRWPAKKHKIWEHDLYSRPELIFRTFLFRPTALQVKNSRRSFEGLIHTGYSLQSGRASHPYVGLVIPAFHSVSLPVKIPGYLAAQVGPYFGWPFKNRATTLGLSLLYDRQFAYFYGLYFKAHWVNNRSAVEAGSGASDFTWSFGASIWLPFMQTVHFRPGLRFDTDGIRPLLDRTVWDLQIEFRR